MRKLSLYIFLLHSLMTTAAFGQDIPPVYSQFYMNPTVYNPAFAGSDGYTSLYLVHRRQWIGIEGAPLTSTLSMHTPFSRTTAAGMLISHDKAGILQNINAEAQFAYIIPFGDEHNFRMGLAAGMSRLSLDLSEATPEQRAYLANRPANQNHFRAKFGINYHYKKFNIGLSSNSLFQNSPLSGGDAEFGLAPLQDIVVNAIYYIPLIPDQLHIEPYAIYQRFASFQRSEGGLLFYFKNNFWTGASYRSDYGITGLFGLSLKETIRIAYAYEFGNTAVAGFMIPSHEIQIALKLGKERSFVKEVIRKPRFEF